MSMHFPSLVVLVAASVALLGCSSGRPPADGAKRPSGDGWYCRTIFESDLDEAARCVRTQAECERITPYERARDARCRSASSEVCFTDAEGAQCFDGRWYCNFGARLAVDGGRKVVSACESWD